MAAPDETYFDHVFTYWDRALGNLRKAQDLAAAGSAGQLESLFRLSAEIQRAASVVGDQFQTWRYAMSYVAAYEYLAHGERSYTDALEDGHVQRILEGFANSEEMLSLTRALCWHVAQWHVEGARSFEPSRNLCRRLQTLQVQGAVLDDIQLPFNSFYLHIPSGEGPIVKDSGGHSFPLRGVWVTEGEAPHDYTGKSCPAWHFFAIGKWGIEQAHIAPGLHRVWRDQIYFWRWLNPRATDIGTAVRRTSESLFELNGGVGSEDFDRVGYWLVNLLLFLSDPDIRREYRWLDPEVAKLHARMQKHTGRKRQRIKDELRKRNQRRVIVVGANLQPTAPGAGKGKPLEVRQRVRGHEKQVAIGPGRQDRRKVKIAPYWRGPEDGELSSSRYLLR